MVGTAERRVPIHLWIVGILALLWNAYGCYDYVMTTTGDELGLGYQLLVAEMPASMTQGAMAIVPWVIILFAAFLLWYSWAMEKKGVLR
jgi:hypothetical protein